MYQDVAPIICATALQRRPHNRGAAAVCSSPSLASTSSASDVHGTPSPAGSARESHPPGGGSSPGSLQGARFWQKVAISLGEDGGRFLHASLQGECGPGHSAGRCCRSGCRASALDGCPTSTSGGQDRRRACEAISPLGYGCLRAVPTPGRSGTGTQLGTWTRLVWDFGQVFCLPQPLSSRLCPPVSSEEWEMTKFSQVMWLRMKCHGCWLCGVHVPHAATMPFLA